DGFPAKTALIPLASAHVEPALAAHLLTARGAYVHHGLYVGGGRVIHYSGLSRGLRRGPVGEGSLAQFARGKGGWGRPTDRRLEPQQVVLRARSRLGEHHYRLLTNNCEHFCAWCLQGESRSKQVEVFVSRLPVRATARWVSGLARSVFAARSPC